MSTAQPSAFGYNAIPTLHRDSKQAVKNRETREKLMVTGSISTSKEMNPLRSAQNSAGALSEQERFKKDATSFLHTQRAERIAHDNARVAQKAEARAARAEAVAEKNTAASDKHARESQMLAGSTLRGRESVGYSLISGVYTKPEEAEKQRQRTDRMAVFVQHRTERLNTKVNSTGYNIITGEPH